MVLEDPVSDELILDEEIIEDESENPLTNSVPTAVVLGAADVPEEHTDQNVLAEPTNTVTEVTDEM